MSDLSCPKCRAPAGPSAKFCTACGAPLSAPPDATRAYRTMLNAETRLMTRTFAQMSEGAGARTLTGLKSPCAPGTNILSQATRLTTPNQPPDSSGRGGEVKIQVVDVSTSMGDDVEGGDNPQIKKKSKMDATMEGLFGAILAAASERDGSLMGIVSFSDEAEIICKLVPVHDGVVRLMSAARRLSPNGDTAIGAGLAKVHEVLKLAPQDLRKRVTLFTDGHNRKSDPEAEAQKLKDAGVHIEVIGFGMTTRDVDETLLRKIASKKHPGTKFEEVDYKFFSNARQLVTALTQTGMTRLGY